MADRKKGQKLSQMPQPHLPLAPVKFHTIWDNLGPFIRYSYLTFPTNWL